ncbi:MAG: DUF3187 family protein [Lentisphaerae bacterium]|nr:MAG: DUF3187 family protein [Lentisphaerota bacterium]
MRNSWHWKWGVVGAVLMAALYGADTPRPNRLEGAGCDLLDPYCNVGRGHLFVRSLSPGLLLRPNVSMMRMPVGAAGRFQYASELDWGNVYNYQENAFVIDAEFLSWNQRFLWTLREGVEVGFALPVVYRMGGILDGLIEGFHRTMGLGNAHRDDRPRNDVLLEIQRDGDVAFRNTSTYLGLMDIPVFGSWLISTGDECLPAVSLHAGFSIPVGDEDEWTGLGKPLYGVGMLLSKRLGTSDHILGLGGRITYADVKEVAGIALYSWNYNVMLVWEYEWDRDLTWVVEYLYYSPVAKDYYEFSDPIHEIQVGFKYQLYPKVELEFSLMENMFNFNNSTDFGFHLGLTWDF